MDEGFEPGYEEWKILLADQAVRMQIAFQEKGLLKL